MRWPAWAVPAVDRPWAYDPGGVVPAFEALVAVTDETSAVRAYHQLLGALAHNHSGSPYPAIVPGVRGLAASVPQMRGWSLATALDVLTDSWLFTIDDTACRTADGQVHDLTEVQGLVSSIAPLVRQIAERRESPELGRALELLRVIDDSARLRSTLRRP
ncbi:hypothetical protein [Jiangella endophytica]|uniref:hypothetical protein n=1 Tax=Jiangella endophytica TaxID=1623398 RepID=UPI000E34084D|nr:hypothetical protein [Jiangella endophytica]